MLLVMRATPFYFYIIHDIQIGINIVHVNLEKWFNDFFILPILLLLYFNNYILLLKLFLSYFQQTDKHTSDPKSLLCW